MRHLFILAGNSTHAVGRQGPDSQYTLTGAPLERLQCEAAEGCVFVDARELAAGQSRTAYLRMVCSAPVVSIHGPHGATPQQAGEWWHKRGAAVHTADAPGGWWTYWGQP